MFEIARGLSLIFVRVVPCVHCVYTIKAAYHSVNPTCKTHPRLLIICSDYCLMRSDNFIVSSPFAKVGITVALPCCTS